MVNWQRPIARSHPAPFWSPSPPSVHLHGQADSHHTDDLRLCHSCAMVRRPLMGVLCGCRQTDRESLGTAAFDHGQLRLVGKGFFLSYGPPGTVVWFMRKAEGRMQREEGGRSSDLQIAHSKKLIGLIWEHAHTCAGGKGNRKQTEPTDTDIPPSDRISAMHLSLFHFLCLDLESFCSYSSESDEKQLRWNGDFKLGPENKSKQKYKMSYRCTEHMNSNLKC